APGHRVPTRAVEVGDVARRRPPGGAEVPARVELTAGGTHNIQVTAATAPRRPKSETGPRRARPSTDVVETRRSRAGEGPHGYDPARGHGHRGGPSCEPGAYRRPSRAVPLRDVALAVATGVRETAAGKQ